jgi:heme a synthase
MADSFFNSKSTLIGSNSDSAIPALLPLIRRLVYGISFATLVLMAIGSATRVMNAGLACPDWPLCYGSFVPAAQMNLQVFLEWFHRVVATSMGVAVLGLTAVCWRYQRSLPAWLPISITMSLGLIILQGILGGLTVTQLLRFDIVTAHLATGLLFFSSMVVIGSFLMPYRGTGVSSNLYVYGSVAALCVYLQSVLGALVASRWAVHQCLDTALLCRVLHSHVISAVPVSLSILVLAYRAWKTPALHPDLRRLYQTALGLVVLQVLIGTSTLHLHLQVAWLTVLHQATAAALFGTLILFSVIALRDRLQSDQQFAIPQDRADRPFLASIPPSS